MSFTARCLASCLPWLGAAPALAVVCEQVPLAYLVSHPDSCDGERIAVTGYLTYGTEHSMIWLSKEDAEDARPDHGLRLEFAPDTEIEPASLESKELLSISGVAIRA